MRLVIVISKLIIKSRKELLNKADIMVLEKISWIYFLVKFKKVIDYIALQILPNKSININNLTFIYISKLIFSEQITNLKTLNIYSSIVKTYKIIFAIF